MSKKQLKDMKILFVEDEQIIRKKTASSLSYIVKEVVEASNGVEALEKLENHDFDLLITDLQMPQMNGVELIKKIRQKNKNFCIVVLTAHTNEEYLLDLISMHIEQYIIKPINLEKLINALEICSKSMEKKDEKQEISLPKFYSYDQKQKLLKYKDEEISLTKKEILFLELLFKNQNSIISYKNLEEVVWENTVMTDNALRSLVSNLRKKLPKDFIHNLSGIGYKIV